MALGRTVATLMLVALGAAVPVQRAHAYERDVHYLWTWYLALQVGYTERQAYQIASAVQAVADDPDTTPLESTAWDLWRTREAAADSEVARTWRDMHCFADRVLADESPAQPDNERSTAVIEIGRDGPRAVGDIEAAMSRSREKNKGHPLGDLGWVRFPKGPSKKGRFDRSDALWEQTKVTGNPGPQLHYAQDCWSHREWDNRRGHAFADKGPEWASADLERAQGMTKATLDILESFKRYVLEETPKKPDMERIHGVLAQLFDENSLDITGLQRPQGRFNPYTEFWPEQYEGRGAEQIVETWGRLESVWAKTYATGLPDFSKTVAVLSAATVEDKFYGRVATFESDEWWELPPTSWLQVDLDREGVGRRAVKGAQAEVHPDWKVERVRVATLAPRVDVEPPLPDAPDHLYKVRLSVPYTLSGQATLPALGDTPVLETCKMDRAQARVWRSNRANGTHTLEVVAYRSGAELRGGEGWKCTIAVQGMEPVVVQGTVPAVERVPGAPQVKAPEMQPWADRLAVHREQAWQLAGDVATACSVGEGLATTATASLVDLSTRTRTLYTSLSTLEGAVRSADASPDAVRVDVKAAREAEVGAREGLTALLSSVDAACAVTRELESARDPDRVRALMPREADTRALEKQHATVRGHADTSKVHAEAALASSGRLDALEADSRLVQDGAWMLDSSVGGVERSLADGAALLASTQPAQDELAKKVVAADADLAGARGLFANLKGTGAQKKSLQVIEAVHADAVESARIHAGCIGPVETRIDGLEAELVKLGAQTSDLTARHASANSQLPGARALFALRLEVADAQHAKTTAYEHLAKAAAELERGQMCVSRSRILAEKKLAP